MKTTKVVYNACYGGFGLSDQAKELYYELSGESFSESSKERHCPFLVQVVETLGSAANGFCARLEICEINVEKYMIDEYDGSESVITESDMTWVFV